MNSILLRSLPLILPLTGLISPEAKAAPQTGPKISVQVDAREISRSLLHARVELPATPGEMILWYPKWIPGVHAPGGPVQNLGGLRFKSAKGETLTWRRDEDELARFHVTVPAGVDRVVAELDYICNQPSVNSSGVDSFGDLHLGVVNWNTVLLYPEGASIDAATASVQLTLPEGWRYGTALKPVAKAGAPASQVNFEEWTLRKVVDSPLICGEYFRDIELTGKNTPPAFLHAVSDTPAAIQFDDKLIAQYKALVAEAVALFGGAHFDSYHFLLVCSDQVPVNGLEHMQSSFNVVGEREIIDEKKRKLWPAYLLPHEFVHSWCGKYRRPAGMVTTNFHTNEHTRLLWVYEGLTQYLGEVLTVRAGLLSTKDHLEQTAGKFDWLRQQVGRRWRSVEDTAVATWQLRAHSEQWAQLRRSQDYYDEGLTTWLEADAIIRDKSGGKRSLDDFCKAFFATKGDAPVAGYELDEITGILKNLVDYDWPAFFRDRVQQPRESLDLAFLETLGYRAQYSAAPSEAAKERDQSRKQTSASASLGLTVGDDGKIKSVIPTFPGDKAGLTNGMIISGVNGKKYSSDRLKDAIADSVTKQGIELLILDGETFRTVKLAYAEGPKYLELIRRNDRPDILSAILKPTTTGN